jgi:hypothetical protein
MFNGSLLGAGSGGTTYHASPSFRRSRNPKYFVQAISEGGEIIPRVPLTGTYAVNPDCSGNEMITNTGQNFDLYIKPSGEQFRWIETDPGVILSGDEVRSDERGSDK